ncbi:MAG: DegT/DnrJ/EryC1/StrS family aminotransferase [Bacteroidales bacterium]|nr:DegT/DnrJ/EryC1/StrS family aminotransferase [Bacteroidales bacterium]MCF8351513.1 DegT/DnrJ/EryC1/StrS family aminotransferase [Bacteroidales bacterium]MCF8377745.1 DegT/DnrJ/EryC1/StrS family aminotransferase [Bacteroidales bacterium]MCF8402069.1 DegT/DnrJ/EryC1/StrS family aminotransferase [Bacteroidales bacterium]
MIPFSPPRIDERLINEVADALRSGWITTGPRTKKFEQKLTAYAGHGATLCVSSCSAGLELMLRWFGVGEGDEVVVPAYTYAATANVIVHTGARPVFVDCSKDDFNLSVEAVEKAITPNTKAIIPVDVGGWPCDYDELNQLVERPAIKKQFHPSNEIQQKLERIFVLSDAAHSLGAKYKGKKTGNLTDCTVYSFHAVKNLTTAEGGAVCLNLPQPFSNEEVYQELNIKALHGQSKDALAKFKVGSWKYDVVEAGYKYNMTDVQAAMGLVELERYDNDMLVKRKHIFDTYSRAFSKFEWAETPSYENEIKTSSHHAYMLRIKGINENARDRIMQEIFKSGISVNVHFLPLPMMSFYKNMGYQINDYPNTYARYANEISLPVFYDLSDEQIQMVVEALRDAVEKVG